MKTKLSHPADGLYYVTENMMRNKTNACDSGITMGFKNFPKGDEKVPLTLATVTKAKRLTRRMYWLVWAMGDNKKVTYAEQDIYYEGKETPRAVMDMLLARAKREGLA